eukprot:6212631-Pleurochrysis_carterae.AAC.1
MVPCVARSLNSRPIARSLLSRSVLAVSATSWAPFANALAITRLPAPSRIVAIGDIQGDLGALIDCLEFSDLYTPSKACWTGGDAVLVQTGDVLDRGPQEREILELLRTLKLQAAEADGTVITLLGNHEYFNSIGDMNFVSEENVKAFGKDRVAAFRPGSPLAREMSEWPVIAVVGDTAFVHAGLIQKHARDAGGINQRVAKWLRGEDDAQTRAERRKHSEGDFYNKNLPDSLPPVEIRESQDGSPLLERKFSKHLRPGEECSESCRKELFETLRILKVSRLVVGHHVQGLIQSVCDGRYYKIDTAMSKWVHGRDGSGKWSEETLKKVGQLRETLEIVGDQVTILKKGQRIPAREREQQE